VLNLAEEVFLSTRPIYILCSCLSALNDWWNGGDGWLCSRKVCDI